MWFFRIYIALLLVGVFTNCGPQRTAIRKTNFIDEIDIYQNLTFEFNEPIVAEAQMGKWDSASYLQFSPAIPGRFQWVSPQTLLFSPAYGFAPSTGYSAKLNPAAFEKLIRPRGNNFQFKEQSIAFHTPYLQPIVAYPFWYNDNQNPRLAVKLKFNYPIEPTALQKRVTLQLDNQTFNAQILTQTPDSIIELLFLDASPKGDKNLTFTLEIDKGLQCKGSVYRTSQKSTFSLSLAPINQVVIYETALTTSKEGQTLLQVFASQSLVPDSSHIRLLQKSQQDYWYYYAGYDSSFVPLKIQSVSCGANISAVLPENQRFELLVAPGARGTWGKVTELFATPLTTMPPAPYIAFADAQGKALSSKGNRNIGIKIRNVEKFTVKIAKVYENNLLSFLQRGAQWGYYWNEALHQSHEYLHYDVNGLGDVIFEKTYQLSDLPKLAQTEERLLQLDALEKNKNYKGVYVVEVIAQEQYWIRASKEIILSDIGLIAHQGARHIWVAAQALLSAAPLSGVKINLISTNNQVIGSAITQSNGSAQLTLPDTALSTFRPALITATWGDELSYLHFQTNRVETSRFPVEGKTLLHPEYDAYLYGDRTIYRPGEKVNVNIICRSHQRQTPAALPLELKIFAPQSKLLHWLKFQLNDQGAHCVTFELPPSATTGQYNFELQTPGGKVLQTYSVLVEEFIPDNIRLTLSLPSAPLFLEKPLDAKLQAHYFWGAPAAEARVESELLFEPHPIISSVFPEYNFALAQPLPTSAFSDELFTDSEGNAALSWKLPQQLKNQGLVEGKLLATVFEESGNYVSTRQTFLLPTQSYFLGIKKSEYYFSTGKSIDWPIAAVNERGEPYTASAWAEIKILYHEWENVLENVDGSLRYISKARTKTLQEKQIAINGGRGTFAFSPILSGEYEIRLSLPGASNYIQHKFYAYGQTTLTGSSFSVPKEGLIEITPHQTSYKVGQIARVLFKTPFDGKLRIALATQDVLETFTLETQNHTAELRFPITAELLPNFYVLATLVRPLSAPAHPLTVANGIISVKVEDPKLRLPVKIVAASQFRSQQKINIQVHTEPGAEVTLACVDEGILQLQNTPSPSAYSHFYGKRALAVTPYHGYGLLLPELGPSKRALASTGGGAMNGASHARRQNPFGKPQKEVAAFWLPPQKANSAGVATFAINLPLFAGRLRCTAIGYHKQKMGEALHYLTVVDPLVLQLNAPEFLTPGDTLSLPVLCQNTENTASSYTLQLTASAGINVVGSDAVALQLPPRSEKVCIFRLAAQALGAGRVVVTASGKNNQARVVSSISIRPPYPLTYESGNGYLKSGQKQNLALGTGWLLPEFELVLSPSPLIESYPLVASLLRYPHGCLEQTVAAAFPQIYFTQGAGSSLIEANTAHKNVQSAIAKIFSLQRSDGAFQFWPGGEAATPWVNAFVAHFLGEAQRAGYQTPQLGFERLLKYLETYAAQMPEAEEPRPANGAQKTTRKLSRASVYALWVLVANGKKPLAILNRYKEKSGALYPESRLALASAFAMLSDKKTYQSLLPSSFTWLSAASREHGQDFYSPLREKCFAYYVLLAADPTNNQYLQAVRQLAKSWRRPNQLNTQEAVFGFLAIGKLQQSGSLNGKCKAQVLAGNQIYTYSGKEIRLTGAQLAGPVQIITSGEGGVYYYWQKSGVPLQEPLSAKTLAGGLQIERQFYNKEGQLITSASFTQNELVVVKLRIAGALGQAVENMVATDLLPAGFRLENPRLRLSGSLSWVRKNQYIEHQDYRSDRVHFYFRLPPEGIEVYYAMRAIRTGTFTQGASSVEAMYDPSMYAQTPLKKLKVINTHRGA